MIRADDAPARPPRRRRGEARRGAGRLGTLRHGAAGRPALDLPTSLVGTLLVLVFVLLHLWNPPLIESLRLKAFDELQLLRPRPAAPSGRPVIVDIDDRSLNAFGQWPWPRTTLARLTDTLSRLGAGVVVFDVIFAEADQYSPFRYAERIRVLDPELADRLRELPDDDAVMAEALARQPAVLGTGGLPTSLPGEPEGGPGPTLAVIGEDPMPYITAFAGVTPLVPVLRDQARGAGLVTMIPDVDGIVRRVPLVGRVGDRVLLNLALEGLRVMLGESTVVLRTDERGLSGLTMRGLQIPTDPDGRVWLRYNTTDLAPSLSAADVLDGKVAGGEVAGRIVLIGSSAAGLGDIKTVPGGATMPGVQVQAELLETLTSGTYLHRPLAIAGAERTALVALGLALAWYAPRLRAAWLPLLLAATIIGSIAVTWVGFVLYGLLIDGGYLAVAFSALLFWLAMAKFIREEMQRRTIREAFGLYLSPVMVDKLTSTRQQLKLGGERRRLTILFSDLRGFTTLSEQFVDDPEALTGLLTRYLTAMTEAVHATQGTIDKFIGDGIMAFWGAPLPLPGHAREACRAALSMRQRLELFNSVIEAEHLADGVVFEPLRMGIGINTGDCFVGNLGSDQRFSYSVMGDAVNVAARLEGRSKTYGTDIVLGETTYAEVRDFAALEFDRVRLVGKTQATRLYGLLGDEALAQDDDFLALAADHEAMLAAYRAGDWEAADRRLQACRARGEDYGLDPLYDLYVDRLRRYRSEPLPEGWDGSELALFKS